MALTFFGTELDHAQVYQWLLDFPEMKLFEDYSRPDHENRWFDSWEMVEEATDLQWWSLAAWSESIGGRPRAERISFDANTRRKLGAKGRTALRSPSTIKLGRNNDQNGCLASSSISCWTEKGARQRSIYSEEFLDEVNWSQLQSMVRKVERQIKKSAPAKIHAYAIMPNAFEQLRAGRITLWNWGEPCAIDSPHITYN